MMNNWWISERVRVTNLEIQKTVRINIRAAMSRATRIREWINSDWVEVRYWLGLPFGYQTRMEGEWWALKIGLEFERTHNVLLGYIVALASKHKFIYMVEKPFTHD